MAAIPALNTLPTLPSINGTGAAGATKAAPDAAQSFGDMVTNGLDNLQQTQAAADDLATQAATGDLTDLHDYMIASTQASLATELTVSVRNKAVDAFNEIMRMQI
jgi:flagellar hook-basal body complex protein FliE